MKTKILVVVMIFMVIATLTVAAQNPVKILINGVELETDVAPVIQDGRVLVPIRAISEKFGADVSWDPDNYVVHINTSDNKDDYKGEIEFEDGFYRPEQRNLPKEITEWINLSLEVPAVQEKYHNGYRYVLITEGMKPTGGYGVEIKEVIEHKDKLELKVNSFAPGKEDMVTQALTYPYELIIVEESNLPVSFTDINDLNRYFMNLIRMEEIDRPIVAGSEWIKIFTPEPNMEVEGTFSLTGIASVFEGTVSYELLTEEGEVVYRDYTTAAMGDWAFFEEEVPIPKDVEDDELILQLYSESMKDGSKMFVVEIPLILGNASADESGQSKDWKPTTHETVNDFAGVTMTVKEETVTLTGMTVEFENNSDSQCTYGEYYLLEKKINDIWYQVPVAIDGNYGFTSIGYDLDSGESRELKIDWDWLYGSLDTGEYRVVKDILKYNEPGIYDKYYLAAEFTI